MADSDGSDPERLRLLVVEDEALIGMMIEDLLEDLGHEVVQVIASVRGATEFIATRGQHIDVAVLDANLGGWSAAPVADALRQEGIPFVVASGYNGAELRQLGFDGVSLRKPYQRSEVETALSLVCPKRH